MRTVIFMMLLAVVTGCGKPKIVTDGYVFNSEDWAQEAIAICTKRYNTLCLDGDEILQFTNYGSSIKFVGITLGAAKEKINTLVTEKYESRTAPKLLYTCNGSSLHSADRYGSSDRLVGTQRQYTYDQIIERVKATSHGCSDFSIVKREK